MITLVYGVTTLNLRNPELGDIRRIERNGITRPLRGGDIVQLGAWPINNILVLTFTTLTKTKRDELEAFLIITAGCEINYTDPLGQNWYGYIITGVNEIITINDACSHDASFEFLGQEI